MLNNKKAIGYPMDFLFGFIKKTQDIILGLFSE